MNVSKAVRLFVGPQFAAGAMFLAGAWKIREGEFVDAALYWAAGLIFFDGWRRWSYKLEVK